MKMVSIVFCLNEQGVYVFKDLNKSDLDIECKAFPMFLII